ncbi:SET domain-containing protein-lysine N-methyltransferase [Pandoraea pulmonicola]|uniref:SET domain-containing protein-lysine N-methyltransferase n=1 Tax=Pandoraea pulmonicola TaxID=93221 RepID=UPI001C54F628|nr:SET domain-containing protein-lysine N-methyltransferase [Pandoraea pulmonicola]
MSHIVGVLSSERKLHTLQVSESTHLYDPYFAGLLLHSCSPSVMLDMKRLEVFALRDIEIGEFLTMDYASTEDILARQFPCACHSANCRHWITGAKEEPNDEGVAYLAKFHTLA